MGGGRARKGGAVGTAKGAADDSAALSRLGLLIETVKNSIATIITAPSVIDALPDVLDSVARVVPINHVVIAENLPGKGGHPTPSILFKWQLPGSTASPLSPEQIGALVHDPAFQEWMRPLESGIPVVRLRRNASDTVRRILTQLGVLTSLIVPIMIEGRHWGQIGFDDCESEHDWVDDDIKILTMMAEVIGVAITRERFRQQAQQREQLLQAVTNCAAQIGTARDLHEAIGRSLGIVAQAVGVDRMTVMEAASSGHSTVARSVLRNYWHAPDVPMMLDLVMEIQSSTPAPDVIAWTAPLQHGVTVEGQLESAQGGIQELFERLQIRSLLVVPIMVDGRYWGRVSLDVCRNKRVWSSSEKDVLRILADLIGTAITRERQQAQLATANTIIQNSPTILYRLRGEPSLPMIYVSQNIALLGHDPAELIDTPTMYRDIIHPDDRDAVQVAMAQLFDEFASASSVELRMLSRTGAVRWVENRYAPVRDSDGRLIEIEGVLTDITERKAAEEKITQLARTDGLTGLANRMTFGERLFQSFATAQRRVDPGFAVLYLDLDRFKEINDTLGHHAGDRLLQEVARRLQNSTRETDMVARLGGDEFGIVQSGVRHASEAETLAEKLIAIVSAPYCMEGNNISIGVSVGIALHAADVGDPDVLLRRADQALYRVKRSGRGQYCLHYDDIDDESPMRQAMDIK